MSGWPWPAVGPAGGGGAAPVSKLQPLTLPGNIIAAYAFNEPAAPCNTDRSGNGNNFVTSDLASELANVQDLVPGKAAVIPAGSTLYSTAPKQCRQYSQAWLALYGECSTVLRVWGTAPASVAGGRTLMYCNAQDTTNGSCALQLYVLLSAGVFKFGQYSERNKAGQAFTSALEVPPNEWTTLSYRRSATGLVTLGTHRGKGGKTKAYESYNFGQLPATTVSASMSVSWAQTHWGADPSDYVWSDQVFWNVAVSDAVVESQAAVMMASAT